MGTVPATLYGGSTNSTGMAMPVINNPGSKNLGSFSAPSGINTPQAPAVPVAPTAPAQAPNGLTVTPNPGTTTGTGTTTANSTGVNAGAPGTNTGTMSNLTPSQAASELSGNQTSFGAGGGALLTNYLQTGAGYNGAIAQQTINATDNAMQQQINQQYGGLQTSLADAGLSPDSSASALASSQFLSNASAQENQVAAQQYTQMYSQSQQDYLSALQSQLGLENNYVGAQISNTNANTLSTQVGIAGSILGMI